MGDRLGYRFDSVQIRRDVYAPQGPAHAEYELGILITQWRTVTDSAARHPESKLPKLPMPLWCVQGFEVTLDNRPEGIVVTVVNVPGVTATADTRPLAVSSTDVGAPLACDA